MPVICTLVNAAALAYGGAVDHKKREIPDLVHILLLATGLFSPGILQRIQAMLLIAAALWLAVKLTRGSLPGGDLKLLCALAFSVGLSAILELLFLVGAGTIFISLMRRVPVRRNIPLCTYVAAVYFLRNILLMFALDFF